MESIPTIEVQGPFVLSYPRRRREQAGRNGLASERVVS